MCSLRSTIRTCFVITRLLVVMLCPIAYAQTPSVGHSLDAILNPDGSLKNGTGLEGSYRADGYRMVLGAKGEPRFIPTDAQTTGSTSSDTADIHWDSRFATPTGFDAPVRTIYVDGGSVYFGGDFTIVGTTPANGVAKWDGTSWSSLGSGIVGSVYAISKFHGDIYVGGYILRAGGIAVNCIARWDGTSWSPLGIPPNDGLNDYVLALLPMRDSLYIVGNFSWPYGDTTRVDGVAIWNGTSMIPMPGNRVYPYMPRCLATDGKNLYIGGRWFTLESGGSTRYGSGVIRWDGTSWEVLGTPAYNGVRGFVHCMTYVNGSLYVGGTFDSAGGTVSANNVARWNGTTWSSLGAGLNKDVNGLTFLNGKLYAAGDFTASGIDTMNGFASYDTIGGAWNLVSPGAAPRGSYLEAVDHNTSTVFLGGIFGVWGNNFGGVGYSYFAASWSNGRYTPAGVTSVGDGISGYGSGTSYGHWSFQQVNAVLVSGPLVYVGGNFTSAGSTRANNIACWNTVTKTWSPLGRGLNGFVTAMVANGSELYAGGRFDSAGNIAAQNVARWDGTSWHSLGVPPNDGVQYFAFSLVVYSGNLYVGGVFSVAGGATMHNIARWDGSSWYPLGSGIFDGVYAMAVYGDELYAGGPITQAGGVTVKNLARWDGVSWKAVGTAPDDGVNGPIYALTVHGGDLYAGGSFSIAGATSANSIARWDGSSWVNLGPGLNGLVRTIMPAGASVYVGGDFTGSGVRTVNRVARWDTSSSTWSTLGSGANAEVFSIGIQGEDIYVGGQLTGAGGKASAHFARWNSTFTASGVNGDNPLPASFALEQNYPNPFNPTTTIEYNIGGVVALSGAFLSGVEGRAYTNVRLTVYDILGREVAVLVNEGRAPGSYSVEFDGSKLASGVYVYRLAAGSQVESRKMVLMK